ADLPAHRQHRLHRAGRRGRPGLGRGPGGARRPAPAQQLAQRGLAARMAARARDRRHRRHRHPQADPPAARPRRPERRPDGRRHRCRQGHRGRAQVPGAGRHGPGQGSQHARGLSVDRRAAGPGQRPVPSRRAQVSRGRLRFRRQAQHPAHAGRAWLRRHRRPRADDRRRGAGDGAGRHLPVQRPRRPGALRLRHRGHPRVPGPEDPAVRHLPGPPAARPGRRREHAQDEVRPPRRQPPGDRPGSRPGDDHLAEPRLRARRGDPAGQRPSHPPLAVRWQQPGHRTVRCAGIQLPGAPGGESGAAGRGTAVRPFHRFDADGVALMPAIAHGSHGSTRGEDVMRYLLAILLLFTLPGMAMAADVPIRDFFKDAEFESVQLSPDGEHIAVVMPRSDRSVLVVLKVDDKSVVGSWDYGKDYYFQRVTWANSERILYATSFKTGRFDFQVVLRDLYASNIDGTSRIVIPHGNFYGIVDTLPGERESVLVTRSIDNAFLFKLNVYNGRISRVASSPLDYGSFLVDHAGNVRYSFGSMSDGSDATYRRDGDTWSLVEQGAPFQGLSFRPVGFSADDKQAFVFKSPEGGAASLWRVDPVTGAGSEVSNNRTVSPTDLLWSSDHRTLLAVRYDDGIPYWDFIAPDHPETALFAGLVKAFPGKVVAFSGISEDGNRVLMHVYSDRDPGQVYLFDRKAGQARFLLSSMEWIKPDQMSQMKPVSVKTRDGLVIHGYLTIPAGSDGKGLPLIVNPHGGPHGPRDEWAFNPEVQ